MSHVHFVISSLLTLNVGMAALPSAEARAEPVAPSPSPAPTAAVSGPNANSQQIMGIPLPPSVDLPPIENAERGIFGGRIDVTRASSGHAAATAGAMFVFGFDAFGSLGSGITRLAAEGGLGGGGAGFEGDLGVALSLGKRWDVVEHGGPFVRVGGEGRLGGNDLLYDSRLIVPELEAGFQVLRSPHLFDAALYAGPMLDGRAGINQDSRRIAGGLGYGARVSLRQGVGYLGIDAGLTSPTHGFSDQALSVVGRGCVATFSGLPLSFCLDARAVHADEGAEKSGQTAEQIGASLGFGI